MDSSQVYCYIYGFWLFACVTGKLSASMKPKVIVKPRSVLQVSKRPHIINEDSEPSNDKADGKKHDIKEAHSINGLQSLFQNYDSDDSD